MRFDCVARSFPGAANNLNIYKNNSLPVAPVTSLQIRCGAERDYRLPICIYCNIDGPQNGAMTCEPHTQLSIRKCTNTSTFSDFDPIL